MLPKKALIILLFLFTAAAVFGEIEPSQPFQRSAILDAETYNSLPRKMFPQGRTYEPLAPAVSLRQYAPLPGDQEHYGTCVGWAAAYAAKTIMESVALNRMNQTETTRNVFSPVYIYRNIQPDDPGLLRGAQIHRALDLMAESGAVRMSDAERTTASRLIDLSHYSASERYPIAGYHTLFSREDRAKPGIVLRAVKRSLAEANPVIIAMNTPDSFVEAKGTWTPHESPANFYGGHALCVTGYDDSRNGGAFEVMNSWGRKWGNGGFMWIPYRAFADFVMEGYEITR